MLSDPGEARPHGHERDTSNAQLETGSSHEQIQRGEVRRLRVCAFHRQTRLRGKDGGILNPSDSDSDCEGERAAVYSEYLVPWSMVTLVAIFVVTDSPSSVGVLTSQQSAVAPVRCASC